MDDDSFLTKPMFGSLALYYRGLNVAILSENPGENSYRGKKYSFDLWDGVLVPTFHVHHDSLKSQIPSLISHPVLGKWLYLPRQTEEFEEISILLVDLIRRQDPRIGVEPAVRARKKKRKVKKRLQRSR